MKSFLLSLILFPHFLSAQTPMQAAQRRLVGTTLDTLIIPQYLLNKPADTSFTGKFKVLEFWATWCAPCLRAVPHINKLQRKFSGENIVFLSVTYESEVKTAPTFERVKFETIVVSDSLRQLQRKLAIQYNGTMVIPRTVLIDDNNRICWYGHPDQLTESRLRKFLRRENLN